MGIITTNEKTRAKELFKVLLCWEPETGLWATYVPELDYLSACGRTREQAIERTRRAIADYQDAASKHEKAMRRHLPEPELLDVLADSR